MKRWLPALLLICVVIALAWYFSARDKNQAPPRPDVPTNPNPTGLNRSKTQPALPRLPEANAATIQSSARPALVATSASEPAKPAKPLPYIVGSAEAPPTNIAPQIVLENMRRAVVDYGSTFSGNPVGTNPEITAALNGQNAKQIKFIDPERGLRINGNGELVDPWGTPFFFHQLSAKDMEIRSAGPDKVMWTADDLVIK